MMKKIILSTLICTTLVACSSKPDLPSQSLNQPSQDYYGEVTYQGDSYQLSPIIYTEVDHSYRDTNTNTAWRFKLSNLEPAFKTQRYECSTSSVASSMSDCEDWADKEAQFINVSFTPSSYGDTPTETIEKEQIEADKPSLTTGDIVSSTLAAVTILPIVAIIGVVVSPAILIGSINNPDSPLNKNWVEFNHEEFNSVIKLAISQSEFEDVDTFLTQALLIEDNRELSNNKFEEQKQQLLVLRKEQMQALEKYYYIKSDVPQFEIKDRTFKTNYIIPFNSNHERKLSILNINNSYKKQKDKMEEYYVKVETKALDNYGIRQQRDFKKANTEHSLIAFIQQYKDNDAIGLVPKANVKLSQVREYMKKEHERQLAANKVKQAVILAENKAKQAAILAEVKAYKRKIEQDKKRTLAWRESLKPGDDTFCGPIIEIRGDMIRIALTAQLSGYSNDSWLKRKELYPSHKGCINRNGRLSPQS